MILPALPVMTVIFMGTSLTALLIALRSEAFGSPPGGRLFLFDVSGD
jgi:hypothetical protein